MKSLELCGGQEGNKRKVGLGWGGKHSMQLSFVCSGSGLRLYGRSGDTSMCGALSMWCIMSATALIKRVDLTPECCCITEDLLASVQEFLNILESSTAFDLLALHTGQTCCPETSTCSRTHLNEPHHHRRAPYGRDAISIRVAVNTQAPTATNEVTDRRYSSIQYY